MILQALKEYYDRKASDPDAGIAPPGFERKEIPYVIVLRGDGTPVSIQCTYEGEGRQRRAKRFLVPQGVKRACNIAANLLWDNPEYAVGVVVKSASERVKEQHAAFVKRFSELDEIDYTGLRTLKAFLPREDKEAALQELENWVELKESGLNVSFSLAGEQGLIVERPLVRTAIEVAAQGGKGNGEPAICLVTGRKGEIERLHAPIKGVRGAQTMGANIVSFNLSSFASYGKEQGANAPIRKGAVFAYTTALNHLLDKDSRQRILVGDATAIFWAEKPAELETAIVDIFDEPPKDDPDRGVKAVKSLYDSVETGTVAKEGADGKFYVLGLAPNASRIAIRFWIVDTISKMSEKLLQHFEDLKIVHGPKEKDVLSLFRLLVSTAPQGKSENIPPNLAGDVMRAALTGLPYPRTLLQALVRRLRAEHDVTYVRAALLKACINRDTRFKNDATEEELKMSLDLSNMNIGYRLGRLFAALEKIQGEANPGINATIKDRFYGAASGTPVAVFSNLMRLKNHHLAKLESHGRRVYFEKLIAEIMDAVSDFPPHLALADQGRFAVGYYHQNQQFFIKKDSSSDKAEPNKE